MEYSFYKKEGSILDAFYAINNIKPADLETAGFSCSSDHECLLDFRDKLLARSDRKVLIVGDYDCDGICSTAIMKRLLDRLGIVSNFYIPSRIKEGYGLSREIVEKADKYGFPLIICVDNGVVATEALNYAKERCIEVMIVDHHEYEENPDCLCLVHPSLLPSPYDDLCGGGLCYLISDLFYKDPLSLVYGGLATLADMVSVFGFNRWLLRSMISVLNRDRVYQIDLLCDRRVAAYDYDDLSFSVIPKINAISRMEPLANVNMMVRYLLSDYQSCEKAAFDIRKINEERKRLTNEAVSLARRVMTDRDGIIWIYDPSFHEGLLGVIANRFMNELHRPVIVATECSDGYKCSGRAPDGCDIHAYLSLRKELYLQFGGHCQAVGLTVSADCIDEFREYVLNGKLEYGCQPVIEIGIDDLDMKILTALETLKPFGTDMKEPLFVLRNPDIYKKTIMAAKYPKYLLRGSVSAISFNESHKERSFSDMIGHIRRDSFRKSTISFMIEDLI